MTQEPSEPLAATATVTFNCSWDRPLHADRGDCTGRPPLGRGAADVAGLRA